MSQTQSRRSVWDRIKFNTGQTDNDGCEWLADRNSASGHSDAKATAPSEGLNSASTPRSVQRTSLPGRSSSPTRPYNQCHSLKSSPVRSSSPKRPYTQGHSLEDSPRQLHLQWSGPLPFQSYKQPDRLMYLPSVHVPDEAYQQRRLEKEKQLFFRKITAKCKQTVRPVPAGMQYHNNSRTETKAAQPRAGEVGVNVGMTDRPRTRGTQKRSCRKIVPPEPFPVSMYLEEKWQDPAKTAPVERYGAHLHVQQDDEGRGFVRWKAAKAVGVGVEETRPTTHPRAFCHVRKALPRDSFDAACHRIRFPAKVNVPGPGVVPRRPPHE